MKGARYRSAIFLSGAGRENSLEDALMHLTEAVPGSTAKQRIKGFTPHLANVPPPEVTYKSKRRNSLFTYGCEDFRKVTRFKVRETEDSYVIELHLKTAGGFPTKWVKALSTSLPDWRLTVFYQSRDDHVKRFLTVERGEVDVRVEDTEFELFDDVELYQRTRDTSAS